MTEGKHKITGERVNAEHLVGVEGVDIHAYCCPGCGYPLQLCSYRPTNKNRAHFRETAGHSLSCMLLMRARVLLRKKEKAATKMGERYQLVSKLIIRATKPEEKTPEGEEQGQDPKSTAGTTSNKTAPERAAPTNRVTTLFENIVDDFLDFHEERHLSPLSVPGVLGDKYHTVFAKIKAPAAADYRDTKIYYGELLFSQKPTMQNGFIEIPLAIGTWEIDPVDKRKKLKDALIVRVDFNGAESRRVNQAMHSLEITRIEQIEQFENRDIKKDNKPKGYAFFLGRYIDGRGIVVDSPNLICFRCTEIQMPEFLKK